MHTAKEQICLIHRLAGKRRVQFLSTLSLGLSSVGNYVWYEADVYLPKDRMTPANYFSVYRKQVVTIFINHSSVLELIHNPVVRQSQCKFSAVVFILLTLIPTDVNSTLQICILALNPVVQTIEY